MKWFSMSEFCSGTMKLNVISAISAESGVGAATKYNAMVNKTNDFIGFDSFCSLTLNLLARRQYHIDIG